MAGKMDDYVAALYEVLSDDGAESIEEIMIKMQRRLGRHVRVTRQLIYNVLHFVRKHPTDCGYDVPYVKRGPLAVDDLKRYFAIPMEPDGTFKRFDSDHRDYFNYGGRGTVRGVETTCAHLVAQLNIAMPYEPSPVRRDIMEELRDECSILRRSAARAVKKWA
jgi:hypothetical protein